MGCLMPPVMACPDAPTLKKIALGDLSLADADGLLEHLANCSDCATRLGSIAAEDALVDAVRSREPTASQPEREAVRSLLEKVRGLVAETNGEAGNQTVDAAPPASVGSGTAQFSFDDAPQPAEEKEDDGLAPPQADDEIGRLGPYRILKVLGEGGMGKVFLAEDPGLQRQVALKVMKKSVARNLNSRKRFIQEARTAAKIEHDNIVHIYQVGEDRGVPFLAMPLLKGSSLEDILRRKGALQLKQTLRIGMQIAEGLAAAHASNLIHRDVKPANLWIEPTAGGRVKILDFGLARPTEGDTGLTQSGAILGTPAYMPPEQARGEKVDHRADLYSLGCVLYRMATGELPIKGNDTMSILMALAMHEPAAPSLLKPAVPKPLSDVIMQLLAKDPAKRLGTAKEAVQAASEDRAAARAPTIRQSCPNQSFSRRRRCRWRKRSSQWRRRIRSRSKEPLTKQAGKKPLTSCAAPPNSRRPAVLIACAAAAVFLLLGAGGIVYRFAFQTADGTLLVEVDENADVRFKKGKLELRDPEGKLLYELSLSDKNKKLPPGDYLIDVVGADGLMVSVKKFTLKKNGEESVRVSVAPPAAVAKGDPPVVKAAKFTPIEFATLDHLDPAMIPPEERFAWQPKELVAVLGEHRGRHWGSIAGFSVSPDSKSILVWGHPITKTQIFDAATLRERAAFGNSDIETAVYSPDGKTLITANSQELWLWDIGGPEPKKRVRLSDQVGGGPVLAISKDGKTLVVGSFDQGPRIWDLGAAKPRKRLAVKGGIRPYYLAPDGKSLITVVDNKLHLWDISSDEPKDRGVLHDYQGGGPAAFSPDSKTLVTVDPSVDSGGGGPGLQFWDVATPKPTRTKSIKVPYTVSIAFAPDGKTLAWSSAYNDYNVLRLAELTGPEPELKATITLPASIVQFTSDGKSLVTMTANNLRIFDVTGAGIQERVPAQGHAYVLRDAMISPDGKIAVTFDGVLLRFWDLTGPAPRLRVEQKIGVQSASFSPDSKTLASSDGYSTVLLWDMTAAEPEIRAKILPDKAVQLRQVAFAADGKALALYEAAGTENRIRLWDVSGDDPKEKAILAGCQGPFVLGPDGTTLACGNDAKNWLPGSLQLWDLSGKEPKKSSEPFGEAYVGLALSPNGKTLASFEYGKGVKLWDLSGAKPKLRTVLEDPDFDVHYSGTPAFAPDGKTLAYAAGKTVSLWDVQGRQAKRLRKWHPPGDVAKVTFAPDGRHLITANGNGTAYVLRLDGPTPSVSADARVQLFNGKNFDGWEGLLDDYWSIKDGAIVGNTAKGLDFNTFLCTKAKYADFEMSFQVKLGKGGNSGVQIRSHIHNPQTFAVTGPQCDMGGDYWGSLYGENFGGMMKATPAELVKKVLKEDDFNDYYIKCVGKHVTIKLNGQTTVDEDFPTLPASGIIALQLHGGPPFDVIFRNIQFK